MAIFTFSVITIYINIIIFGVVALSYSQYTDSSGRMVESLMIHNSHAFRRDLYTPNAISHRHDNFQMSFQAFRIQFSLLFRRDRDLFSPGLDLPAGFDKDAYYSVLVVGDSPNYLSTFSISSDGLYNGFIILTNGSTFHIAPEEGPVSSSNAHIIFQDLDDAPT